MRSFNCFTIFFLLLSLRAVAQQTEDSVRLAALDEVTVTATRSERKLGNVAVPVTLITREQIRQAGSLRLKDILQEQTGLFITNGFGAGVQMQGLNPDYTMIMIDGEPLVGRTTGVLDLNRVTVGNIRKIEIVKGPSSSLYGSEALAGVINIITDRSFDPKLDIGLRYGTYKTIDANATGSTRVGKLGLNAFINNYNTDGYSIRPSSVGRAILPVWRGTAQIGLHYPLSGATSLNLSIRYNQEQIKNELAVTNNGQITYSRGKEINKDWNITPSLTHQFNERLKTSLRLYGTFFQGAQDLITSSSKEYYDLQRHQFYRVENQTDYAIRKNLSFVLGAGLVREQLQSTRYDDERSRKINNVRYAFFQNEWNPLAPLRIITGVRYDNNQLYASALSPKLAILYHISKDLRMNASFGRGFKAPDFRQLYLNFTNTAAGSYSVFGTIDAVKLITELKDLGQIAQLEDDFYRLHDLKPEFSNGLNIGFHWTAHPSVSVRANFFRNDIQNLIDTRLVALKNLGQGQTAQIFSYLNVSRAYTQGAEAELSYRLSKSINVSGGYQLLFTADKDQLKEIRLGRLYTRDADGFSRIMRRSDYFGLPNKSRHMANLKLAYEPENRWFANTRAIYRSKWAVTDKDGNGVYNDQDEFAAGFVMLNMAAGKSFRNGFRFQAGIDNLFDYNDVANLPNMPGRSYYASVAFTFTKNNKTQKK